MAKNLKAEDVKNDTAQDLYDKYFGLNYDQTQAIILMQAIEMEKGEALLNLINAKIQANEGPTMETGTPLMFQVSVVKNGLDVKAINQQMQGGTVTHDSNETVINSSIKTEDNKFFINNEQVSEAEYNNNAINGDDWANFGNDGDDWVNSGNDGDDWVNFGNDGDDWINFNDGGENGAKPNENKGQMLPKNNMDLGTRWTLLEMDEHGNADPEEIEDLKTRKGLTDQDIEKIREYAKEHGGMSVTCPPNPFVNTFSINAGDGESLFSITANDIKNIGSDNANTNENVRLRINDSGVTHYTTDHTQKIPPLENITLEQRGALSSCWQAVQQANTFAIDRNSEMCQKIAEFFNLTDPGEIAQKVGDVDTDHTLSEADAREIDRLLGTLEINSDELGSAHSITSANKPG